MNIYYVPGTLLEKPTVVIKDDKISVPPGMLFCNGQRQTTIKIKFFRTYYRLCVHFLELTKHLWTTLNSKNKMIEMYLLNRLVIIIEIGNELSF